MPEKMSEKKIYCIGEGIPKDLPDDLVNKIKIYTEYACFDLQRGRC